VEACYIIVYLSVHLIPDKVENGNQRQFRLGENIPPQTCVTYVRFQTERSPSVTMNFGTSVDGTTG